MTIMTSGKTFLGKKNTKKLNEIYLTRVEALCHKVNLDATDDIKWCLVLVLSNNGLTDG